MTEITRIYQDRIRMRVFIAAGFVGLFAAFGTLYASSLHSEQEAMQELSKGEIESVAARRVVFAHQSVGGNILDGVRAIARQKGVPMNIMEGRQIKSDKTGITHFMVGSNGQPQDKINDFVTTLSGASFGKADMALMKLCFVDFNAQTDALALAQKYVSGLKKLQARFPETRFIAVTSPLTGIPDGLKARVKRWLKEKLGRPISSLQDNVKRQQFNDYLRQRFDASHLFDIARVEAKTVTTQEGQKIEVMRSDLTSDGGHLNKKGQRLAGAAFLRLLAQK